MIIKRARAKGFSPDVQIKKWSGIPNVKTASVSTKDITRQASEILNDYCDPENYLFSHVTVVCSVDTNPMDVQIGPNVVNEGLVINRKYKEYDIQANCQKFINNNKDAWERDLLLQCYKTFVGAHNFCFVPGTKVLMADGTYKNIEEVKVGESVISHKTRDHLVVQLFERDYEGDIRIITLSTGDKISCTPNHPFLMLNVVETDLGTTASYNWINAEDLEVGDQLEHSFNSFVHSDKGYVPTQEISDIQIEAYKGKVYNFEVEEDHSYIVYPGVAVHNCEHLQIEEQSKGKIVDAVARDIGESVYVDILIATAKKHTELIKAIKERRINAVSMGCSVLETQCTKCGNTSPDEAHMCRHITMMKGQKFEGPDGKERMIAELCGNKAMEPHGGVRFIEASWVKVPAFKGAVLRNIIDLSEINGDRLKKVASDLKMLKNPTWNPADTSRIVNSLVLNGMMKLAAAEDEGFSPAQTEISDGEENPLESLEREMMKVVIKNVKSKLMDVLSPPKDTNYSTLVTPMGSNNNIVRVGSEIDELESLYNSGLSAITNLCKTNKSRIRYSKIYNDYFGIHIPKWIYVACNKLGPLVRYTSPMSYISVCEKVLNRRLSIDEIDALLKISSILREDIY